MTKPPAGAAGGGRSREENTDPKSEVSPSASGLSTKPTLRATFGERYGSTDEATDGPTSKRSARLICLAVTAHLFFVGVSFCSTIEPSAIASSILQFGHAYLQSTHFGIDGRAVYLAHGDEDEQPLRIRIGEEELLPDVIEGAGACDRQQRWLGTMMVLAGNDQPSLVAELMLPVLERRSDLIGRIESAPGRAGAKQSEASAVELVREPTIMSSVVDDQQPAVYRARLVRSGDRVALVHLQPERLVAVSVAVAVAEPATGTTGGADSSGASEGRSPMILSEPENSP